MLNPDLPEVEHPTESSQSFDQVLAEFEQSHPKRSAEDIRQITGTVVAVSSDSVFVDVGYKTEGVLPLAIFGNAGASDPQTPEVGTKLLVSVKGRNEEGYYELSRLRVEQPKDWTALERAFEEKAVISGTVTGIVKGGLTVDVGVRAFMPGSRSGARSAGEMERLVGQEIRCRIIKLDEAEEDVVVDRRVVAEEEQKSTREQRYSELREGETVGGTVQSVTNYGAFVDIGGIDGLLHISDMAWGRVENPFHLLSIGQQIEVMVLKIDPAAKRISLGLKQLHPHPWDAAAGKYQPGERVRGVVTRVTDFGAFIELEPGIEGLVHLSEMSWARKVRKPGDMVKPGDLVEVMILGISAAERRMSLGLKQTLGDPWSEAAERFAAGSQIEGPVTSFTKFGAFVQVAEGVEGMIHVSELSAEKRIERPQDVLRVGQVVKAKVMEVDKAKRQMRLSMKQLVPTGLDEYLAEHSEGDVVSGRLLEMAAGNAKVELGEGIYAEGRLLGETAAEEEKKPASVLDMSSLSTMLSAKWKNGLAASEHRRESARLGQVRSFRITRLDREAKKIEVRLA